MSIKIEKTEVLGWQAAVKGMRNPLESWNKSDSKFAHACNEYVYLLGTNDYELMKKLSKAGTDHRKFMRMITVYVDITAPLYWWKEFDTYKVGTVANSCSTMHKIHAKEFELGDFSCDHLTYDSITDGLIPVITLLNEYRNKYNVISDILKTDLDDCDRQDLINEQKTAWWQMIQLLPSSYNQKRTVMLNYEVLANIYKSRKGHKLDEWHDFCDWIEGLEYSEIITGLSTDK